MKDHRSIGVRAASLEASYEFYFGPRAHYAFEHVPDTPIWWITKNGVRHRDFTSRYAAQCWLDHVLKHGE
jgi:hypothetical protein